MNETEPKIIRKTKRRRECKNTRKFIHFLTKRFIKIKNRNLEKNTDLTIIKDDHNSSSNIINLKSRYIFTVVYAHENEKLYDDLFYNIIDNKLNKRITDETICKLINSNPLIKYFSIILNYVNENIIYSPIFFTEIDIKDNILLNNCKCYLHLTIVNTIIKGFIKILNNIEIHLFEQTKSIILREMNKIIKNLKKYYSRIQISAIDNKKIEIENINSNNLIKSNIKRTNIYTKKFNINMNNNSNNNKNMQQKKLGKYPSLSKKKPRQHFIKNAETQINQDNDNNANMTFINAIERRANVNNSNKTQNDNLIVNDPHQTIDIDNISISNKKRKNTNASNKSNKKKRVLLNTSNKPKIVREKFKKAQKKNFKDNKLTLKKHSNDDFLNEFKSLTDKMQNLNDNNINDKLFDLVINNKLDKISKNNLQKNFIIHQKLISTLVPSFYENFEISYAPNFVDNKSRGCNEIRDDCTSYIHLTIVKNLMFEFEKLIMSRRGEDREIARKKVLNQINSISMRVKSIYGNKVAKLISKQGIDIGFDPFNDYLYSSKVQEFLSNSNNYTNIDLIVEYRKTNIMKGIEGYFTYQYLRNNCKTPTKILLSVLDLNKIYGYENIDKIYEKLDQKSLNKYAKHNNNILWERFKLDYHKSEENFRNAFFKLYRKFKNYSNLCLFKSIIQLDSRENFTMKEIFNIKAKNSLYDQIEIINSKLIHSKLLLKQDKEFLKYEEINNIIKNIYKGIIIYSIEMGLYHCYIFLFGKMFNLEDNDKEILQEGTICYIYESIQK